MSGAQPVAEVPPAEARANRPSRTPRDAFSVLAGLPPEAPARAEIGEVLRAARRAAELTGHLLAFSRRQVSCPVVLDVRSAVKDCEKMLRRVIGEDIVLTNRLAATPCFARADAGQLEQVITNLVLNARDAMPHGGRLDIGVEPLEITPGDAAGAPPGRYVALTVRDTGTGMSAEVLSHLFEPFFTTKERGRGTGLGLATAYGIVSQFGGRISADSAPGQGTLFRVVLPAAESVPPPARPANGDARAATSGKERILLVEDDECVRRLARRILESQGYLVTEARGGREAVDVARSLAGRIDVLLTDVIMPERSGPSVAREIAHLHPGLRVLYMSGYTGEELVRHGVEQSTVELVEKPFAPRDLLAKVRAVLDAGAGAPETGAEPPRGGEGVA